MAKIFEIFSRKTEKIEDNKNEDLKIIADIYEKNSLVISELMSHSVKIDFESLEVGDFIVKDVVIERKTVSDFLSSMISKRLSAQLESLQQYEKKFLLIEGIEEKSLYSDSDGINPNAIRGFLLDIILKYKVPVIFSKNFEDTAKFLIVLAKKSEKEMNIRIGRKSRNHDEQKQFILEGFPGIGAKTAKKLIMEFGSIRNILGASEEDLKRVLGKKTGAFMGLLG